MKKIILIVALLAMMDGLPGCKDNTPAPATTIISNQCPAGYEWIDQEIYGVHRRGCYPIDFDYEKANKRLAEYLKGGSN